MTDLFRQWEAKKLELDKIDSKLNDEVTRIVNVIERFFRILDKKSKEPAYSAQKPSSKYLGCRLMDVPGYFEDFRLDSNGLFYATGEHYNHGDYEKNTVKFNAKFLSLKDDEIFEFIRQEHQQKLDELAAIAAEEKADAEERKRIFREKKIEKEKEKLKELLVKYYPGEDLQLPAAHNNLGNDT